VIGLGKMGSQIACEFAIGGYHAICVTRDPERARRRVRSALELAESSGVFEFEALADAAERMVFVKELAGSDEQVGLVVESVIEDAAVKCEVLRAAAASQPEAVLASNTSSLGITELGKAAGVSGRIVGIHYWNPPLLMPLVEVVGGEGTPSALVARVIATLREIGKQPVELTREVPGLLWNRLQFALLREALWLVDNGVASPETIDEVVRAGLARRWRLTGPFQTVALGGCDVFEAIADNLFPLLSNADASSGFGRHVVQDGAVLGALSRARDAGLAAELRAERAERAG
jgi:3-hydroxyacyl-CoA dehydrogenase